MKGNVTNSQTMNPYIYALNNPQMFVDLLGLDVTINGKNVYTAGTTTQGSLIDLARAYGGNVYQVYGYSNEFTISIPDTNTLITFNVGRASVNGEITIIKNGLASQKVPFGYSNFNKQYYERLDSPWTWNGGAGFDYLVDIDYFMDFMCNNGACATKESGDVVYDRDGFKVFQKPDGSYYYGGEIGTPQRGVQPKKQHVINYLVFKSFELGIPYKFALATVYQESFNKDEDVFKQFSSLDPDKPFISGGNGYGIMQIDSDSHTITDEIKYNWQSNVNEGMKILKAAYEKALSYNNKNNLNLSADEIARTAYVYYNGTGGGGELRWQQAVGVNKTYDENYRINDDGFLRWYKKITS